jgi:putative sterol carrier protein
VVQLLSEEWVALQGEALAGLPEVPGATARLQHVVGSGKGGDVAYTLAFVDGRVVDTAFGRDDEAADCTFLVTPADAAQIAAGTLDLHAAFMQGRVKMTGDMGRFMAVLETTQGDAYKAALAQVASQTDG